MENHTVAALCEQLLAGAQTFTSFVMHVFLGLVFFLALGKLPTAYVLG